MQVNLSAETRPGGEDRKAPQPIILQTPNERSTRVTHTWSGRHHSEEGDCTGLDAKTGNVTSPLDVAERLRLHAARDSFSGPC